jgi:hypothetical protein
MKKLSTARLLLSILALSPLVLSSVGITLSAQSGTPRKDIPTVAKDALKAVVLIVVSDSSGKELKQGSGVVVSNDGKVATNFHVIDGAGSALVKFSNGAFYLVDGVLATDKEKDIAVLKAAGTDFATVPLGNSDDLQVGEEVVSIGSPLSLEATVSNGIVSSVRDLKDDKQPVFQTTAPISHGSSGGAMLNMRGEIIGIATAYMAGGQNLNFAVPINAVKPLLLKSGLSKLGDSNTGSGVRGESGVARLGDVHTIAVGSFGTGTVGNLVREKLINRLAQSSQLTVIEDTDRADAVLNGLVAEVGDNGMVETGAFRLMGDHGRILWSDDCGRVFGYSASTKMAKKVGDHLETAIEKDRTKKN